jgi:hypothetical protein
MAPVDRGEEEFDSLGHEWVRDTNAEGEPIMTMTCAMCVRVWTVNETIQQIGPCDA